MGGKSGTVIGYRYYLGCEAGLCIGPADAITQLKIGDRIAWKGSITASGTVDIDAPGLFGGDKQEGGVSGIMEVRMGEPTQMPDAYMKAQIGTEIPANRGIVTLVFRGRDFAEITLAGYTTTNPINFAVGGVAGSSAGSSGSAFGSSLPGVYTGNANLVYVAYVGPTSFMWSSNNPYIKAIIPTVTRILKGWTTTVWHPELAVITQTQDISAPPNQTDTGQTNLRAGIDNQQTTIFYPTNNTDLTADFLGYALIDAEWVKVTNVNDGLEGGNSGYFQSMTVTRGYFGTTPEPHAIGAFVYLYAVDFTPLQAMNPAHIVYQCLTDVVWGMGKPTALIDETTVLASATQLASENFGLCCIWQSQGSMEDFITDILRHIDAILDLNLTTGLYELRLVRNNYTASTLPVFDETCIVSFDNFERPGWGETTNDLNIKFTDQATGNDAAVKIQDLANIYIQGQVVSQTHEYMSVQSPALAYRIADRDLRALSTPLAHMQFKTNRAAWGIQKGDPVKVTWPARALDQLIVRVIDIDYGTLEEGSISITAIEDIFAIPSSTYVQPQTSLWANPSNNARTISVVLVREVPFMLLDAVLDTTALSGDESYPLILAQKPGNTNQSFVPYQSAASSFTNPQTLSRSPYTPNVVLAAAIGRQDTTLTFGQFTGASPDIYSSGGLALIDNEWMLVLSVNLANNTMTLLRTVLDSVPATHAAGALVWLVALSASSVQGYVGVEAAAVQSKGITEYYRETGQSSSGQTNVSSAPQQSLVHSASWFNPYPPAKVQFNGQYFPTTILGEFTVTWNGRNRLQQITGFIGWADSPIAPEAGTTYTLDVYDASSNVLIQSIPGLTTDSNGYGTYQFKGALGNSTALLINLYAVRSTEKSQVVSVTGTITGYGFDYGADYGGI